MADSSTSPSPTVDVGSSFISMSAPPTGTRDFAPGDHNDNDDDDDSAVPGGMASYYFVFLMLTLCVIGLVIFLNFRKRRKRRLQLLYIQEHGPRQEPAAGRVGGGRRYWQGRWDGAQVSREEGLNEHGEAPPPYVPKRQSQEHQREGATQDGGGPAVPLQTLSRQDAGLKPPGYSEANDEDIMRPNRQPQASSSSASNANR